MTKFNPNDPKYWADFDPTESSAEYVGGKSQTKVNRSKSASDKRGNKGFSNTMKGVAAERNQTAEYVEKYQVGMATRDNTYQAESNARPDVQAKISASMKGKKKSAEHNAKVAAKNKERSKPIITPWGEFSSRKAAVIWAQENTDIVNVDKKIQAWVKKPESGFYYK